VIPCLLGEMKKRVCSDISLRLAKRVKLTTYRSWKTEKCELKIQLVPDVLSMVMVKLRMLDLQELWDDGQVILCTAESPVFMSCNWTNMIETTENTRMIDTKLVVLSPSMSIISSVAAEEYALGGFWSKHWTPLIRVNEDTRVNSAIRQMPGVPLKIMRLHFMGRQLGKSQRELETIQTASNNWFCGDVCLRPSALSYSNQWYDCFDEELGDEKMICSQANWRSFYDDSADTIELSSD